MIQEEREKTCRPFVQNFNMWKNTYLKGKRERKRIFVMAFSRNFYACKLWSMISTLVGKALDTCRQGTWHLSWWTAGNQLKCQTVTHWKTKWIAFQSWGDFKNLKKATELHAWGGTINKIQFNWLALEIRRVYLYCNQIMIRHWVD